MKKALVLFLLLSLFSAVYSLNVDLKAAPQNGTEPLTVNLWDSSTDCDDVSDKCLFEWDFEGDGIIDQPTNSPDYSVNHIYSAGYYYPKLRVTNLLNETVEVGCSNCAGGKIEVALSSGNWLPWANPNGPYKAVAGTNNIELDSTGSGDKSPGNIPAGNYNWKITTNSGNPNCPTTASGQNPVITCDGIGTATVELTVTDNGGATDTNSTTLKTVQEQTTDYINIVKIQAEPETLNKDQEDLTIIVTIRNVSSQNQTFDIDFQVKNMDGIDSGMIITPILGQTINAFDQKDFVKTITSAELTGAGLKTLENYWVYVTAKAPGETNITLNSRRAVFSYNEIRTVQIPETNFIGIIMALLSTMLILKKR
ncbi:hypothetical protein KKG83_03380 [Candidatus Micrarchaeota archaeon]|nr:hypothetical protein [Candidatus Micrarchaeota archaeon]MBU2476487.1 hypothetical protein [Candidatus Micrarchaeota archaeon]